MTECNTYNQTFSSFTIKCSMLEETLTDLSFFLFEIKNAHTKACQIFYFRLWIEFLLNSLTWHGLTSFYQPLSCTTIALNIMISCTMLNIQTYGSFRHFNRHGIEYWQVFEGYYPKCDILCPWVDCEGSALSKWLSYQCLLL